MKGCTNLRTKNRKLKKPLLLPSDMLLPGYSSSATSLVSSPYVTRDYKNHIFCKIAQIFFAVPLSGVTSPQQSKILNQNIIKCPSNMGHCVYIALHCLSFIVLSVAEGDVNNIV